MLRVLSPGALATIQDLGREGYERLGVPISGAMDAVACEIANRLLGNAPDDAVIEITAGGAALEVIEPGVIAIAGADLGATLNRHPLPMWTSVFIRAGQRIEFEGRTKRGAHGVRAYVAIAGGVDVPRVLGSRSTYLPGGFGGLAGRALREGDVIRARRAQHDLVRIAGRTWPPGARPDYSGVVRILPGPHANLFDLTGLTTSDWRVSTTSNRIGLRLEGAALHACEQRDIQSFGVFPGMVQMPPNGQPILLMADAQPTGGYPLVAVAIQADLHRAAQLLPGDVMRFELTTPQEAAVAWRTLRAQLDVTLEEDEGILLATHAGATGMAGTDAMMSDLLEWRPDVNIA